MGRLQSSNFVGSKVEDDGDGARPNLTSDAVVKLADFGLAKYYQAPDEVDDDANLDNTVCGTPVYMAPEILGYRQYGVEADLWSIGVIFLEMIVGCLPWQKA